MDYRSFERLIGTRWVEAQNALRPIPGLTWDIGDYPHFHSERGYGVTFIHPGWCHMRYAEKILHAPRHRADGIVRHELGHVVDALIPQDQLDAWAKQRGVTLPRTPEMRADAIAQCIWGEPIRYDKDLVQSTSQGRYPRPKHLGL